MTVRPVLQLKKFRKMGASVPRVSVCIPVYNCEQYVGQAIESVLAQTYTDFELIILDNCSTDSTGAVIRRYNDSRIRLVENETNIGAAGNWNKALSEATGEFIKLLCADDYLYDTCLERQLLLMDRSAGGQVVMVCCGRDVVDNQGNRLMKRGFGAAEGRVSGKLAIKKTVRSGTNLFGEPSAVLLRAAALKQVGLFDGSRNYVIDLDYWCRLLLQGEIAVIPESLAAFRVSTGSWSCQVADTQSVDFCNWLERISTDPRYGLNHLDLVIGKGRAILNKFMRKLFYRLMALRRTAAQ